MTEKPQRFKILRSFNIDALEVEVSEHLGGIEHVDEKDFKMTYLYALHGETRVLRTDQGGNLGEAWLHEQNVIVIGVTALVERVKAEASASEAIQ